MAEKTWSTFYDEVLIDAPGVPQALALNQIRNAAIDFFGRSFVWLMDHPAISAVANDPDYAWAPGTGMKVARAEAVWYDGNPLDPQTGDALVQLYQDWKTETGTPLFYLQESPELLTLVPMPAASLASAITAKVAVKPSRAATGIPDYLWEKYLPDIAHGALAKLKGMGKVPWTDRDGAAVHAQAFSDAIDRARFRDGFKRGVRSRQSSAAGRRRFM